MARGAMGSMLFRPFAREVVTILSDTEANRETGFAYLVQRRSRVYRTPRSIWCDQNQQSGMALERGYACDEATSGKICFHGSRNRDGREYYDVR